MKLQTYCNHHEDKKYILTFKDEVSDQEPVEMELTHKPSDEFVETFMKTQFYNKVIIKEVSIKAKTVVLAY
ncbi:hypothetical protein ACI2JA_03420 [Alkalihalobacillus sp. NPDC078783]